MGIDLTQKTSQWRANKWPTEIHLWHVKSLTCSENYKLIVLQSCICLQLGYSVFINWGFVTSVIIWVHIDHYYLTGSYAGAQISFSPRYKKWLFQSVKYKYQLQSFRLFKLCIMSVLLAWCTVAAKDIGTLALFSNNTIFSQNKLKLPKVFDLHNTLYFTVNMIKPLFLIQNLIYPIKSENKRKWHWQLLAPST